MATEPADTIKLLRGDADEPVAGAGGHHRDVRAPAVQPAGGDQRTTTVAARPGEHDDAAASRVAAEEANPGELREVAARGLHHLGEPDSEVVDHDPIDLDHLRGGQPGQRRRRASDPTLVELMVVLLIVGRFSRGTPRRTITIPAARASLGSSHRTPVRPRRPRFALAECRSRPAVFPFL